MRIRSEGLSFDDVLLEPKCGLVASRGDVDLSTRLTLNNKIRIPIVSAPMATVTDSRMAVAMSNVGGAAFLHRNCSKEEQYAMWKGLGELRQNHCVGCAIGLEKERYLYLYNKGVRLFCLDVAHAHTKPIMYWLHDVVAPDTDLVIGNIATADAVSDFISCGFPFLEAFRVGIGPGAACTTREKTGFGVPQLTAIMECADAAGDIPIIADGGIKNSGDIVKALAAGASSVMLGRLLAGAKEAPHPGKYWGEASSRANRERNGGLKYSKVVPQYIEGVEGDIPIEGSVKEIIDGLLDGVRSGISYGGGRNIKELQINSEFIPISHGVHLENGTRI